MQQKLKEQEVIIKLPLYHTYLGLSGITIIPKVKMSIKTLWRDSDILQPNVNSAHPRFTK